MKTRPMKAETVEKVSDLRGCYPLFGSPKYDGLRAMVLPGGRLVSSRLKSFPNLSSNRKFGKLTLAGLDGELISGPPNLATTFNTTTRALKNVEGGEDVKFYVFDYFLAMGEPFEDRMNYIRSDVNRKEHRDLILTPQILLPNERALMQYEEQQLEDGYEGIMLRNPRGLYKFGRSTFKEQYLLKRKPTEDSEGYLIGFEEQMENTNEAALDERGYSKRSSHKAGMKPKGTLGVMILWDPKLKWEVRVGTIKTWTNEDRQEFWDNREAYLKKKPWMKYRFQRYGTMELPRQVRGLGWRADFDAGQKRRRT